MKLALLDKLVCPDCKLGFILETFERKFNEVKEGLLICPRCEKFFAITKYIPRILSPNLYSRKEFIEKYRKQLIPLNINIEEEYINNRVQDPLYRLKKNTIKYFGFEWLKYAKFGWNDLLFNIDQEKEVFKRKSLIEERDFSGKLVLDAGCGNGRYSYWAANYGAEVIGIDIGDGVESAWRNLKHLKNAHIIQGDIYNLPFKKESFDIIFSIGVLMHTGNAKLAAKSLVSFLKKDGSLSVHVYHRGTPLFELNDFLIRKVTTRLSIERLVIFTDKMYKLSKTLDKLGILKIANFLIRLETHPHCIFDWYSAPIATHHTYREVFNWFDQFGLKIVKDNMAFRPQLEKYSPEWAKKIIYKIILPTAVSVRGIKRS